MSAVSQREAAADISWGDRRLRPRRVRRGRSALILGGSHSSKNEDRKRAAAPLPARHGRLH